MGWAGYRRQNTLRGNRSRGEGSDQGTLCSSLASTGIVNGQLALQPVQVQISCREVSGQGMGCLSPCRSLRVLLASWRDFRGPVQVQNSRRRCQARLLGAFHLEEA